MTPFENYVFDSARQNAFNLSKSENKSKNIIVYVEGVEDKSFWSHILSPYIKPLEFHCFSNETLRTGKKGLKDFFDKTGKWLIICLDSDYDYLLHNAEITQKKGIFQTYAYATENLKCYAESLHTVCTDVTHNPTEKINFVTFLEEYSKIIYQLFIWHLYFLHLSNEDNKTDFYALIQLPAKFNLEKVDSVFESLEKNIAKKTAALTQCFPQDIEKVTLFSNQLKLLGLEDTKTYLFIQGHTLYDNVVLNLLRVVCDNLKTDSIKEINNSSAESEHKNKTREDYINKVGNAEDNIKLTLSRNKDFKSCFLFKKITADIENYLATFKQQTQGLNHV